VELEIISFYFVENLDILRLYGKIDNGKELLPSADPDDVWSDIVALSLARDFCEKNTRVNAEGYKSLE
jgi:hypothetical protein